MEITDAQRSKLLELAARRGEKGFRSVKRRVAWPRRFARI
jgi:hypothetical protein